MSGDVQPRKRKDKKRKRDDRKSEGEIMFSRQSSVQEDDESSHGVHITKMGTEDVHLHVHQEHGTGGHWCAKILFFSLLAILLGLVSLIIMENRGLADLDTPLSESRFSNYFDGWVDEKRESHDDHDSVQASIKEHDEHDEPFEEEEVLSEADEEDLTAENDDDEEEEEDDEDDDDEHATKEDNEDNRYEEEDEDEKATQEAEDEAEDEENSNAVGEEDDENEEENATQENDNTLEDNGNDDNEDEDEEDDEADNITKEASDVVENDTVEQNENNEDEDNDEDNEDEDNDDADGDDDQNDDDQTADNDDDDDDEPADTKSVRNTKEESKNEDDPFDEDDDDDDDDDGTFEFFENVVDNDAEELLILQKKQAEMSKNHAPTSEEVQEAAEEPSSWLSSDDIPSAPTEAMMKRRVTIAGPEDTFPEDIDAPMLPKDESEEEIDEAIIEFIEEDYEDEYDEEVEEEEEIEVDEDGVEIERSGKYKPETFEHLNKMYGAREIKERSPYTLTGYAPNYESYEIRPTRRMNLKVPERSVRTQQQQQQYQQYQQQKPPPIFKAPPPPSPAPSPAPPPSPAPSPEIRVVYQRFANETINKIQPTTSADIRKRNITHDFDYRQYSKENEKPYYNEDCSDNDEEDEVEDDVNDDNSDLDDISDVDDTELMQRLEAKYGKLPTTTDSVDNYESDEDVDDPTWTQIKPTIGAQDFDEDDSFEVQLKHAKTDLERENFADAYVAYSKLSQEYADQPQAFFGKCKSLYELNKRDESKLHTNALLYSCKRYLAFDELIENNREYRLIADIVLDLVEELGVLIQARNIYDNLMTRFPDDIELKKRYALNEIKLQSYTVAEMILNELLSSKPFDGFALAHYGLILKLRDKNYEKAIPLMRKGIDSMEKDTEHTFLYLQLGEAYQRLELKQQAREIYKEAVTLELIPSAIQRPIFYESNLRAQPFWSINETSYEVYFKKLQENWRIIRQEGMKAISMQRLFQNELENLRDYGTWKMFELYSRGLRNDLNCKQTPKTCALMDVFPAARNCRHGQVKFSVMEPKTHIWPHCGPTNTRLRAHLGLTVPEGVAIRVGEENRTWTEGEFLIFDDSFEHEVWHYGKTLRLVLIIDVWHPDLSEDRRHDLPSI